LSRFEKIGEAGLLLETLEPHIVHDRVIALEGRVMDLIISHYSLEASRVPRFERIILHLDVTKLSGLEKLLDICKAKSLMMAMFLIYNLGLGDYFAPMRFVMDHLRNDEHDPVSKQCAALAVLFKIFNGFCCQCCFLHRKLEL
jgi:hypothetical protein